MKLDDFPYCAETVLERIWWSPEKGHCITLILDTPDTEGHPFQAFKRGLAQGQRFKMAFEPIMDNEETPSDIKERRELKPSQKCAIRCKEAAFQEWIYQMMGCPIRPSDTTFQEHCTEMVKKHLAIRSRKELDTNQMARLSWEKLETQYLQETGQMAVDRSE